MCNYFSCIITENLKVHWLKNTAGHEDILAAAKLEDKKLTDRDFVRIEIVPKNDKKPTRNKDDWILKVDEERTLPDWYEKNVIKAQKACWVAWEESVKIQLVLDDERHEGKDMFFLVYGSGRAVVYGSGRAVVYGSGLAVVYDSGRAEVHDSGRAVVYGSGLAVVYGSGLAVVYGSGRAEVYDSGLAEVYGSGRAEVYGSGRAEVYDSGLAEVYGSGRAEVHGSGLAVVHDSGKVELKSTTSVAICNGKIFVHSQAQVIVKDKVDASKD